MTAGFSTPIFHQILLSSLSFLLGVCEIAQWVELLAAYHDGLSSVPRSHIMEGEKCLPKIVL